MADFLGECHLIFEFSIVCYRKIADFLGARQLIKTYEETLRCSSFEEQSSRFIFEHKITKKFICMKSITCTLCPHVILIFSDIFDHFKDTFKDDNNIYASQDWSKHSVLIIYNGFL